MSIRILTKRLTDEALEARKQSKMPQGSQARSVQQADLTTPRKERFNPTTILFSRGQKTSAVLLSAKPNEFRSPGVTESVSALNRPPQKARWTIPGGIAARFGLRDLRALRDSDSVKIQIPESGLSSIGADSAHGLDSVLWTNDLNGEGRDSQALNGGPTSNIEDADSTSEPSVPITIELQSH